MDGIFLCYKKVHQQVTAKDTKSTQPTTNNMPPSIPLPSSLGAETACSIPTTNTTAKERRTTRSNRKSKPNQTNTPRRTRTEVYNDGNPTESTEYRDNEIQTSLANNNNGNNINTNPYSMMPYSGTMYGSPYYGSGPMMMMGGPFSGIYQVLFGVQNVVFSLTQAVQLLGTNQHAIQQAFDSLTAMMDHALATFQELRALEAVSTERETEEQKRRRQRLRTLRWAFMMGSSWLLYKLIRRLTSRRRRIEAGASAGAGITPYSSGYNTGYNNSMHGMNGGGYGSMFGTGGQYGGGGYY